ncbi:MAG: hypothetical protein K2Y16_14175 [Burkholderiales bacterium]|nr:hypothetical protein [Burkholderiales bacterium]
MHAKSIRETISQFLFALMLVGISGIACSSETSDWKSETVPIAKAGEVSLPLRITPVLVEAPPRRIDLLPDHPEERGEGGAKSATRNAGVPLIGLPADLDKYPVLNVSANRGSGLYGIELALDTRDKGAVDTLVRVGDPALFPDMMNERIDFRAAEVIPKELAYKIKRVLGIGGDKKWRYTAIRSKVDGFANGIVSASVEPGGEMFLQRVFASQDLEKTPWLRFEYELPEGLSWVMQIAAKIDRGGLNPKLTTLIAEPVRGGGKKTFLVNLHDLLQKANPGARDGRLEELIIHFTLDEATKPAAQKVSIDLGRLDLYDAQKIDPGSKGPVILAAAGSASAQINLLEALEKRLSLPANKLTVLSGKLVGAQQKSSDISEDLPRISLRAPYREKIPELFAGAAFYLDELSGPELSAVLDQRLFLEKKTLWKSGPSDVIFLEPAGYHAKQAGLALPLVSYPLDAKIDGEAYIEADYSFEGGGFPLYMTLSGTDEQGRAVETDRLLLKQTPVKVKDIHVRKITLSYRQGRGVPFPRTSCIIKNIQISSFKKSAVYHPQPASAYVALDGGVVPAGDFVWRAKPGRVDFNRRDGADFQTVQTFPVEAKIVGDAVVRSNLTPVSGGGYFLRVRGSDQGIYFEKMFPLGMQEDVRLSNLVLHGLDLVFKGDGTSGQGAVLVNQLAVQYLSKADQQNRRPQPSASVSSRIIYLAPHLALTDPMAAMVRPALEAETARPDLTKMNKLDATLSYDQILSGGKSVVLPKAFLIQGAHELNHVDDKGISVALDRSVLQSGRDQSNATSVKGRIGSSKLAKMGLLLVLTTGILWLFGAKLMSGWGALVARALQGNLTFLSVQFVLLIAALYMMFMNTAKEAFSWGGLLLVFAYGFAMRYRVRPYLARKWEFFRERHSAPYFLLFIAILLSCAVMLMFKQEAWAERVAVIGYYLLVTGVAVEFICFAKEAKGGLTAPSPIEKLPSHQ